MFEWNQQLSLRFDANTTISPKMPKVSPGSMTENWCYPKVRCKNHSSNYQWKSWTSMKRLTRLFLPRSMLKHPPILKSENKDSGVAIRSVHVVVTPKGWPAARRFDTRCLILTKSWDWIFRDKRGLDWTPPSLEPKVAGIWVVN